MSPEITESYQGSNAQPPATDVKPADMIVPPQDKIGLVEEPVVIPGAGENDPRGGPSELSTETPVYGTETPYRKTPPTNIGSVAETAATGTPPTGAAVAQADAAALASPVCTVAPAVTGTPTLGQTLTCSNGTWSPAATSHAFQWYRNDVPISGATAATRVLAAGDVGARMHCIVVGKIATAGGSSPAYSNTVGPIAAA